MRSHWSLQVPNATASLRNIGDKIVETASRAEALLREVSALEHAARQEAQQASIKTLEVLRGMRKAEAENAIEIFELRSALIKNGGKP